jgi:hypothetical protein
VVSGSASGNDSRPFFTKVRQTLVYDLQIFNTGDNLIATAAVPFLTRL